MLEGLMQHDFPLTLQHVLGRMRGLNAAAEVVTLHRRRHERATLRRGRRARRPARAARCARSASATATASRRSPGTPSATSRLYLAVPCMGAVLHTLNIRLFAEQLTYIVNHAEDKVDLRRRLARAAAREARAELRDGRALRRHGRRRRAARCRTRCATRSCWPSRSRRASTTPSSTSARPRRSATRAAPPATRRASLYSHRSIVLHSIGDAAWPTRSASARARPRAAGRADVPRQRLGPARTRAALAGADLVLPGRFLQRRAARPS